MSAHLVSRDHIRDRVHRAKHDEASHTAKQCNKNTVLSLDALEARLDLGERCFVHDYPLRAHFPSITGNDACRNARRATARRRGSLRCSQNGR